jgi:hypothetical protein
MLKEKAAQLSGFFHGQLWMMLSHHSCIDKRLANWCANTEAHVATTAHNQ